MTTLTLEQARETVTLCNEIVSKPDVLKKIDDAKAAAAGNPMMLMMTLMPLAIEHLSPTLTKFGFPADQSGIMQFFNAVKVHEEDPEIKSLADSMREKLLSPELSMLLQMMMQEMAPKAPAADGGKGAGGGEAPALD
uniref:Protein C10 n=1 Tax=Eutreptiella gymnastica TaxID=73025 RepID=A0A7S4LM84_9EUGL|eukprot:CAMPEP_0174284756 /NCGR_PEP_ID=MMETSP0809-20121228/6606_1 /TAXON_ID=73025 ORGANISM="Eutreptiella gymnastica-like, Strain CCMP1594" /NCGR_SAMPLE_ID=MMETSP0809 /ASSEMBLY_ACC=CAM_ASM_000658 /LENGTH=136 /DNA_ID=CAMNT_0015380381 /DNA_START=36 /DNA_END=446 /DNA_ORIENTATION=-